jgi:cytoskeletal protein CcmA (bactofilin family)
MCALFSKKSKGKLAMAKDEINAFLGVGTSYEGKLQFQGSVRIDGAFFGQIDSDGTLIVGQEAKIDGQIEVASLILSGFIQGKVVASTKVIMHASARLQGSLRSPCLVMEEGAVLDGEVLMTLQDDDPGKLEDRFPAE